MTRKATITTSSFVLAHVPSLVRYGSKPYRIIQEDETFLKRIESNLRSFDEAVAYPPNQVFIGNISPNSLWKTASPWYENPHPSSSPIGPFGKIISEEEFFVLLKQADAFNLIQLSDTFTRIHGLEENSPLLATREVNDNQNSFLPIICNGEVIGRFRGDHDEDDSLSPHVLLENLAAKATAHLALENMISTSEDADQSKPDFLISCSEEAIGDRYQRGGGNLAKSIGEMSNLHQASGVDVKNFCAGPLNAIILAGSLVASGVFDRIAVVGGGSLPKLGMKATSHIKQAMPILEDVLAGFAALITADGDGPSISLEHIGIHKIGAGHTQQAILESLVVEPLDQIGLKLIDIPLFATELHNPEITVPAGAGNVPQTNYQYLAALAVLRGEIEQDDISNFVQERGLPGFAPSQGHIASAIPALPHALQKFKNNELKRAFFLAKGSLFLGRMTQLSDGISFLLTQD